jgi:hypothetical protein
MAKEINDTYFRRFLVPIVISVLVLCAAAVIISTPPGTPLAWNTANTAMGNAVQQGGKLLRIWK